MVLKMIKIAGEINWMDQFEFQVLWCGSGRAVGPCISSECVSRSTQECWEGSELEICDNEDKTAKYKAAFPHHLQLAVWRSFRILPGLSNSTTNLFYSHCKTWGSGLAPMETNILSIIMSSVRWNLSSSPPPQSKSHPSWQKQRRASMFLHRNKKQLLEWDSSIFMSPAQVHVCSGTSLALQVLGCLCLQEWRKLNCSRKIFQPLCPCPWGCPKCSVSMGKGSFWCPQGNTNAAEPGWGRWVSTQGRHLSSFFLLQVEFRCFQRPRNSSKWPEFYILRLGIFKRGTC